MFLKLIRKDDQDSLAGINIDPKRESSSLRNNQMTLVKVNACTFSGLHLDCLEMD